MQKYTVNAGLLMATEKDPNRSFVFITTLRRVISMLVKTRDNVFAVQNAKKKLGVRKRHGNRQLES